MNSNTPIETGYTPDVLSCLADLSNDEVFTPPDVARAMLDLLPQELFSDPNTTFLDPAVKTGVFLREITKRLIIGLSDKIPNLQVRIDHILKKQVFGIAITELTGLMSRRSLYCSKYPNSKYSVSMLSNIEGNILYKNCKHSFVDGKCAFCGTSKNRFGNEERGSLESHAYEFIHTTKPEEIFNMKFDVIIGNPPYQLNTAGDENGAQAKPIYQFFIEQAIKLNPHYIVMITPSRWLAGGWGLDQFRDSMITSQHIMEIHDFPDASDCFAGVEIKGGVSYFLYDSRRKGECKFVSYNNDNQTSSLERNLKENGCDVVIRNNNMVSIYRKAHSERSFVAFSSIVSGRSPFGLNTNDYGFSQRRHSDDCPYFERKGWSFIEKSKITRSQKAIGKYKLYIPKAAEDGKIPGKIIGKIIDGLPGTTCSGTYLLVGPFETEKEMKNVASYMKTKFFRSLVSIKKITQDSNSRVFDLVPMQDFSRSWNDKDLYSKYSLTNEEISFIEANIKEMD